ncbi:hypothetical protein NQL31_001665 [Lotmaria passim]
MDPQKVLESLAREKGVPLTSLGEVSSRFSQSGKVACCGGLMTRLVTESAADSTVLLSDGSGSCYCALHGDITNRYPDVLTTGALLLFTDVTVLVLSSKVPPLLIVCLQNLAGLLLPDEASTAAVVAASAAATMVTDTADSMVGPVAAAVGSATSYAHLFLPADTRETETTRETTEQTQHAFAERKSAAEGQFPVLGERSVESHAAGVGGNDDVPSESSRHAMPSHFADKYSSLPPPSRKTRLEDTAAAALVPGNEDDDDDDAECLELVDDF